MDVGGIGGIIQKVAEALPFYHGVTLARLPFGSGLTGISGHLMWTLVSGILVYVLAVLVFTSKMKKDVR